MHAGVHQTNDRPLTAVHTLALLALLVPLLSAGQTTGGAANGRDDADVPAAERPAPFFKTGQPLQYDLHDDIRCVTWPLPSFSVESVRMRSYVFTGGESRVAQDRFYRFNAGDWEDGVARAGELLVLLTATEGQEPTMEAAVRYPSGYSLDTPTTAMAGDHIVLKRGLNPRSMDLCYGTPRPGVECAVFTLLLNGGSGLTVFIEPRDAGYDPKELAARSRKSPNATILAVTLQWEPRK